MRSRVYAISYRLWPNAESLFSTHWAQKSITIVNRANWPFFVLLCMIFNSRFFISLSFYLSVTLLKIFDFYLNLINIWLCCIWFIDTAFVLNATTTHTRKDTQNSKREIKIKQTKLKIPIKISKQKPNTIFNRNNLLLLMVVFVIETNCRNKRNRIGIIHDGKH